MQTHLRGCLDLTIAAERVPTIEAFADEVVRIDGAAVLQAIFEIDARALTASLPPALHPSLPAHAVVRVARLPASPWGDVVIAQARIACRAAVSPRGFVLHTFVDGSASESDLASRWGYSTSAAEVSLSAAYHQVEACVEVAGRTALRVKMVDLEPIPPSALRYQHGFNLANTPIGLQLVQTEAVFEMADAQRGRLTEIELDGDAWGDDRVLPTNPISVTYATGSVSLLPVRYVCDPYELAETGSRSVADAG